MKPIHYFGSILSTLLITLNAVHADSLSFTDKWQDSVQNSVVVSQDTGTFSATLNVPGLGSVSTTALEGTTASITFGDISFSDIFANADTLSANSATFLQTELDDRGTNVTVGSITFSRSGNLLIISGQVKNPINPFATPLPIIADHYTNTVGAVQDQQFVEVSLAGALSYDFQNYVNITGTSSVTQDTHGNSLDLVQVAGSVDLTPPTLTSIWPLTGEQLVNGLVTVTNRATDNVGVSSVEFYLNGQDFGPGTLGAANNWTLNLALPAGLNSIKTVASDTSSNSTTNTVQVTYTNTKTNANLIAYSEKWLDTTYTNFDGSVPSVANISQDTGFLNAALKVPGLQTMSAATWSNLVLAVNFGNLALNNTFSTADILTTNKAVFFYNTQSDGSGNPISVGQLTVSRAGNNLIMEVRTGNPSYISPDTSDSLLADYYYGTNGPIQDQQICAINLQDGSDLTTYLNLSQVVYISGLDITNVDGTGNELDNLQVSGAADFTAPTNQIVAPVSGIRVSNNLIVVTGIARDNVGVTNVLVSLNGGDWLPTDSGNNWTNWTVGLTNLLVPGTNVVAAYAVDPSGNASLTNQVRFVYVLSDTLTVVTNGRGSVSPNDNNARLEIGQGYTLTATAAAGFAFTNWTGTAFGVPVLSTNKAALTFIMQSNLTLTATFVDVTRPGVLITNLVSGQRWSNNVFTVMGTASDNVAVSNVMYDFNNRGNWQVATGSNHWAAALPPLTERSNTVAVYAVDTAGNYSPTSRVSFLYILSDTLTVVTNGRGSVSPNDNNARLEIGQGYTLTATAAAGFAFTNWTGTAFGVPVLSTNKAALTFIMQSNLTLTATFVDVTRPGVLITNLVSGQRWSNNVFTVMGTASDNVAVSNVMYDFNNRGNWQVATGSNHWAAALPPLTERSNTVAVYAVDTAGNYSPTSRVSFLYILSDTLTVVTNGRGSVSPNDNNARLEIGQGYTLTATAAAGFAFTNWTGTAFGVPVLSTNKAALTFIMQSNLTLTATFVDVTRPGVLITNLVSGQRWSNNVFTVMGTASDNVAVSNVMYDFNNRGNWQVATGSNHWAAALPLLTERSNTVAVYAVDTAGNYSPTSRVSFLYIAPPSLVGIWNMVQFQTPAQITFDVNNGLQGGGNFAVTNGTMTINGDGSLSGHLGADFTGTYTTGIDGTVTANLTTSDGTEVHTFYVNNRKDTLTTADSLNDANNNQQEIVVAHRGPVTVVAADIAGVWNLVQFKTPALITNDINTSLRGGDSFETTNGSLTLNANGTFSGHLNNPITGTFNIGGNGIINLLSSSGTHTFYLNADEDTMTLVDSMYGPNDNQQEMVVAQRVPASVAVADLAGTWNLTQFQTPAAITNDLSNGVQGGGNFEVVNGSMTVSANGAVSGNLTGAFTGTLTIGASGAITLHITSGGNETHTFYVNAGKNTLILTDRQLDSNNNQQETVVAQRVPAN